MNKKGSWTQTLLSVLFICCLIILVHQFVQPKIDDYKAYREFCKERPNFCYCSLSSGGCEYKISWNSKDGPSEDTKALCELAKELEDKKTIFKAGCE